MFKLKKKTNEKPHPMLCFHHGGSPGCEESNKENNFLCPLCKKEHFFSSYLFLRVTHQYDYLEECFKFREDLKNIEDAFSGEKTIIGIHALYSGRLMDWEEIIDENREYYEQYKGEKTMCAEGFSKESVIHDLEMFVELGIVAKIKKPLTTAPMRINGIMDLV